MKFKRFILLAFMVGPLALDLPSTVFGQELNSSSPVRAKAIVVLRATLPPCGELHSVDLDVRSPGQDYMRVGVGINRGLPISGPLVAGDRRKVPTHLLVPVVGRFDMLPQGLLFENEGSYELRWTISFKDKDGQPLVIEQTIQVAQPISDDAAFLSRLSTNDGIRELLDRSPPSVPESARILSLLAALLEYSMSDLEDVQTGLFQNLHPEHVEVLAALARELPDSSYAPYAAYYAAGSYLRDMESNPESRKLRPTNSEIPAYKKADQTLQFVANRGDLFIKLRALYRLAYLRAYAAAWAEADEFLEQIETIAPADPAIRKYVQDLRDSLARERQKHPES